MPCMPDDILRVAARMNYVGIGDFVNVFHFRCNTSPFVTDGYALVDMALVMDALYDTIAPSLSDYANFVDVNVFNVTQDRPLGSTAWPTQTTGEASGDVLPSQCAAFVRATTGYSRNWARKFLGPFLEASNTSDGRVYSTLLTRLANFLAEWLVSTAVTTGTYTPVVYHSKTSTWKALVDGVVRNVWATVRRRRVGRGS
jgi:hypothetical protein